MAGQAGRQSRVQHQTLMEGWGGVVQTFKKK